MCVRGFGALLAGEAPSCGGSPREGARSELANGAATGGGGAQPPPTLSALLRERRQVAFT